jgi:hypothetical protein
MAVWATAVPTPTKQSFLLLFVHKKKAFLFLKPISTGYLALRPDLVKHS